MQLGVCSYAFGWAVGVPGHPTPSPFTETDLLAYARTQGLKLVQFGDHLPLHSFDVARMAALNALAGAGDDRVEIEIGVRGLTEAHLARSVTAAKAFHSRLLRFVVDSPGYEPKPENIIALLRNALPVLKEIGLTLALENHDRFPTRTLYRIVESVDSEHVGICLDTANSLGAGEGFAQVLDQLGPSTVNLHIKDFSIARVPHAMGFIVEGRPAGGGMLDIPALCDVLARHGRCRSAVLENWTPPEPTIEATLAKERHWADESLAYLKPLFAKY